jgi:hypothetical protein
MSDNNDGGPAFPIEACGPICNQDGLLMFDPQPGSPGLTIRQYAAIHLGVPESGIDWLDEMIVKANRDKIAGQAMAAIISTSQYSPVGGSGDMLSGEHINGSNVPVNGHGDMSNYDLTLRWVPVTAYALADALLAARKEQP